VGSGVTDHALGGLTREAVWRFVDDRVADLEAQTSLTWPIYILSKARSHYRLVAHLLDEARVPYRVVVEPQDADAYRAKFGDRVLVMDADDQGVAYARNFAKRHAAESGAAYHWQFDDNLRSFRVRRGGKSVPVNPRHVLSVVEQTVGMLTNVAGAGLANSAFVFSHDDREPVVFNTQVYCAMLLRSDVEAWFTPDTGEDTDYSLQILSAGYVTLSFKRVCMEKTPTEQMSGGNTEIEYQAGNGHERRRWRFQNTVDRWPAHFKVGVHKDGRPRLVPTGGYRKFTQHPTPAPALIDYWKASA